MTDLPTRLEGAASMAVSDVLSAAADLLEKPGAWTQGVFARDEGGVPTHHLSEDAECFCVAGAITRIEGRAGRAWDRVDAYARRRGFRHLAHWNDQPGRTQADVVSALRSLAHAEQVQG